ncbi:unnamed protein product, partial [Mesorhabditis belari]|uniref:Peptidase metallopeptidase domain-containing protein n=1 Tax=Mesorhabditis belari TaxID=2138241 RepID=A0AAF3EA94_9BILA
MNTNLYDFLFISLFFITFHELVALEELEKILRRKRWTKRALIWKLQRQLITEADEFIVRNTLHRAFNNWAAVSSLNFKEASPEEKADIEIAFEKGRHSDPFPFDGPDGIVAHAFYPRDGRLHFDADEEWTLNSQDGVNLYQTAVHEIGHLLGLEHSSDPRSAMYAAKRPFDADFGLADDDVRAIRKLFPAPPPSSPSPSPSPSPPAKHSIIIVPSKAITTPLINSELEHMRFVKHPRVIDGRILSKKHYKRKKTSTSTISPTTQENFHYFDLTTSKPFLEIKG